VAGYMMLLALITAAAVYLGPETYRSDIHADSTEPPAGGASGRLSPSRTGP